MQPAKDWTHHDAQVLWQAWSSRTGLPAPEDVKPLTMPPGQGLWLDD